MFTVYLCNKVMERQFLLQYVLQRRWDQTELQFLFLFFFSFQQKPEEIYENCLEAVPERNYIQPYRSRDRAH